MAKLELIWIAGGTSTKKEMLEDTEKLLTECHNSITPSHKLIEYVAQTQYWGSNSRDE